MADRNLTSALLGEDKTTIEGITQDYLVGDGKSTIETISQENLEGAGKPTIESITQDYLVGDGKPTIETISQDYLQEQDNTFTGNNAFDNLRTNSIEPAKSSVGITSWSFATTTITLTVASHSFVAADMMAVAGLIADTNAPNGVWKVDSVTATTIVFTANATPIGTPVVSSATVRGTMHINGILGFDDADRVFTIGTSTADAVYEFVSPDGIIVGQNSNGEYTKYVDGMVSWVVPSFSVIGSGTSIAGQFTYPIANISGTPVISFTIKGIAGAEGAKVSKWGESSKNNAICNFNITAISGQTFATDTNVIFSFSGIGKWK